jgi:hypothetical protein
MKNDTMTEKEKTLSSRSEKDRSRYKILSEHAEIVFNKNSSLLLLHIAYLFHLFNDTFHSSHYISSNERTFNKQ